MTGMTLPEGSLGKCSVESLKISGTDPGDRNIKNGDYLLCRPL
ncbi:MAG: hypothetical protein V3R65_04705 [Acidiferrobacterales bacterium]